MDAHVHIHCCFPISGFLDAACRNFRDAAREAGVNWPCDAVLLLTESAGANVYAELGQLADGNAQRRNSETSSWRMVRTAEPSSLLARRSDGERLIIVAGRQIATEDGLEVLALATEKYFDDGEPTRDTVETVSNAGAIPVLPWGFGKWMGRRGRILTTLLEQVEVTPFYLGDTSHRLRAMPPPREFIVAAEKAVKVLPGTDPLPFPAQGSRPGKYGFRVAGTLSEETPAADLKALIAASQLVPFGRGEGLMRFVANQLAMQIRKRRAAQSAPSGTGPG